MTTPAIADLPQLGGHPVLDFVNTVDNRVAPTAEVDALQTCDDLLAWSLRVRMLTEAEAAILHERARLFPARAHTALLRAKLLREPLYRLIANAAAPQDADLTILESEYQAAMSSRSLQHHATGFTWRWRDADPDTITHRIAFSAAALLTSAGLALVRTCPDDRCGWLFLAPADRRDALFCGGAACRKGRQASSFLKKRSKKLLLPK